MTQRRKVMPTNFEPTPKVEEAPEVPTETIKTVETIEEVRVEKEPEIKSVVKPEPVPPKKPEPYVRPGVALPKEAAGRRPRNVPRY